jgi:hypothetical protein
VRPFTDKHIELVITFADQAVTEKIAGKNRRTLRFASERGEFSPNGSQSGYSARVV